MNATEIRQQFNDGYYWDRARDGEFHRTIVYQEPASPLTDLPPRTVSEIVIYHQERNFRARVHQYVLDTDAEGEAVLVNNSLPDPKDLIDDAAIWWQALPTRTPGWVRRR